MMAPLSETKLAELREQLREILVGAGEVAECWPGPRSSELCFVRRDGVEVTLSIRARERQV